MDPTIEPIIAYINSHREHGTHDDKIWTELINAGWPYEYIQRSFDVIDGPEDLPHVAKEPEPVAEALLATPLTPAQPAEITESAVEPYAGLPPLDAAAASGRQDAPTGLHPTDTRQKYTLRAGLGDVVRGISSNWLVFFGGLVATAVACVVIFGIVFAGMIGLLKVSGADFAKPNLLILTASVLFCWAFGSVLNTLLLSNIALSLRDGIAGRSGSLVRQFKDAISSLVRVILTTALVGAAMYGPLFAFAVILAAALFGSLATGTGFTGTPLSNIGTLLIVMVSMTTAVLWIFFAFFRFALAPFVALFEPQVSVRATLARSHLLLRGGGKWFMFKAAVIIFAIFLITIALSGQTLEQVKTSENGVVLFVDIVLTFTSYCLLYALYRNRVAVKG
jgi:hypothetical protein